MTYQEILSSDKANSNADSEKSICGKRNGQLWCRIKQNPGQYAEWKNYFWIKSCDLQVRKVGKSVQTSAKSNN